MENKKIVEFCLDKFKKPKKGKKIDYSHLEKAEDIRPCLENAIHDALNRRKKYKKYINDFFYSEVKEFNNKILIQVFFDFAKNNELITEDDFYKLADHFLEFFKDKENGFFVKKFGFAQKFVSMSFKYLMCFDCVNQENFKQCMIPLDKFTLKWYMSKDVGNREIVKKIIKLKKAWSEFDIDLYKDIQNDIKDKLSNKLPYKYKDEIVELPNHKLQVEVIVWYFEQCKDTNLNYEKIKNEYDSFETEWKQLKGEL